jgi:hypothetical protein
MPLAYSSDLAWRVIWRIWGSGHWAEDLPRWLANQIADPVWGLAVSFHYVRTVWARYWQTGDVLTYQGQRQGPAPNLIFDVEQDILLLKSVLDHPRWQLKDHHGSLSNTATGQRMSYSALCAAAWRLHLSRKVCATLRPFYLPAPLPHLLECVLQKVRSLCYKGDRERALIWLADLLLDYTIWDLLVLDETAKDRSVLKGSFGYSLRGESSGPCALRKLPLG